jgi:DNA-binding NarL/FixJ family response regulator
MEPAARLQPVAAPPREASRDDLSGVRVAIRPDLVLAPPVNAFAAATLAAERAARPGPDLAAIWQAVMDRRLKVCGDGGTPGGRYLVARSGDDPSLGSSPLSRLETAVLVRVLWGEQQKLVAAELGIACSTASKWYTLALAKMGLTRGPIALPLVIAAQAWASGQNPSVGARSGSFEHDGARYFVLSVPKPVVASHAPLTPAECEVASFLVEGENRWEIAARRETSAQTVACQLRGIFSKWQLTGRYALIRRAVDSGWFR